MKTTLILRTNLEELRLTKTKLVDRLQNAHNLKKWGDDSVETNDDKIYFLKIISIDEYKSKLLSIIGKGYDDIKMNPVIDEISKLGADMDKYYLEDEGLYYNLSPEAKNIQPDDDKEESGIVAPDVPEKTDLEPKINNEESSNSKEDNSFLK